MTTTPKAPDTGKPSGSIAGRPLAAAADAVLAGGRLIWRAARLGTRGAGKFIATTWRLFGALDDALWRGVQLFARLTARNARIVSGIVGRAVADFVAWLPSRAGRAYSAFSGIILILALLWIVDELRGASAMATSTPEGAAAGPIDFADPILARIEGRYVHLSEVTSAALASGALQPGEKLTPAAAFKRDLVSSFVEQRLLSRAATEEGLHRAPDVARRLAAAHDRILASAFMEGKLARTVNDQAVRKIYDRNADVTRLGEAVKCRHIVVASEEDARAILIDLGLGADFGEIAMSRSLDRSTAPRGGETGYLTREQMTPAFAEAAFSTPEGEIAAPFFTEFGWNILQVVDRRRTGGVPFAQVENGIRRFLTLRTIESTVLKLQEDSDVVYFPVEEDTSVVAPPPLRTDETAPGG